MLFCILAFIGILFVVVRALMFGDPTSGWPSMVCIILLCSGVQLFCTGIVGEYLAKTYLEVKHRPIYIVAETEEDKNKRWTGRKSEPVVGEKLPPAGRGAVGRLRRTLHDLC